MMASKTTSVKKYIVRLSSEKRIEALLRKGKSPAQPLLDALALVEGRCFENR
jgi:hypothetical protein